MRPDRAGIVTRVLAALAVLVAVPVLYAQQPQPRKTTAQRAWAAADAQAPSAAAAPDKQQRRKLPGMTPEREAAVMTFVKNHHPELSDLLAQLKQSSPQDYERAVLELFRASERLALIQERQPDRYELELDLWKSQSRIQLLAARLSMGDAADLKARLQEELERQLELKKELLLQERARLEQRLGKLDEEIDRLLQNRQKYIQQQVHLLTRHAADSPDKDKSPAKDSSPATTNSKSR